MASATTLPNISGQMQPFGLANVTDLELATSDLGYLLTLPPNENFSQRYSNDISSSLNWTTDWSFCYDDSYGGVDNIATTSWYSTPSESSQNLGDSTGVQPCLDSPRAEESRFATPVSTADTEAMYPESLLTDRSEAVKHGRKSADRTGLPENKITTPPGSSENSEFGNCMATRKASAGPRLRTATRSSGVGCTVLGDTGPAPRSASKRKIHNKVEKRYRGRLNLEFEQLLAVLPAEIYAETLRSSGDAPVNRPSKAQVLQLARRHIADLERRQEEAMAHEALLKKITSL